MGGAGLQAGGLEIGQHEGLWVGGAGEVDAGAVSDGAVGAVTADDVVGVDVLDGAVDAGDRAADVARALVDVGQLDAALDGDPVPVEVVVEDRLGGGLGQEEEERVGGVVEVDVEERQLGGVPASVRW